MEPVGFTTPTAASTIVDNGSAITRSGHRRDDHSSGGVSRTSQSQVRTNHRDPVRPSPSVETGGSVRGSTHRHAVLQVRGAEPAMTSHRQPSRVITATTVAPNTQNGTSRAATARRR